MRSSFEPRPLPAGGASAFVPKDEAREFVATATRAEPAPLPPAPEPGAPADTPACDPAALHGAVAALESALEASRQAHQEERRRWMWGALEVGLVLARRVLERELAVDPKALRPLLERALALVGNATEVDVALSPETLGTLEAEAREALAGLCDRSDVTFTADPALGVGEARVRADASRVDVRLDTLLSALRDELVPEWEGTR